MKKFDRKLILEDGSEYYGYGFGAEIESITEIVFNTASAIRKLFQILRIRIRRL